MGLGFSQDGQVQQLYEFRKLQTVQDNFEIPERPENRHKTDRKYLITFLVVLVVLIPFLIYSLMYTEFRIISGSDNCGNFCGFQNKKYDEWSCTGQDFTSHKYQLLHELVIRNDMALRKRECVTSCPPDYEPTFHLCLPKKATARTGSDNENMSVEAFVALLGNIGRDIGRGWWAIVLSAIISCVLCFGALSLFRYAVDFVVWFILIGSVGVLAILAGLCWYGYFQMKDDPNFQNFKNGTQVKNGATGFMIMALVLSIIVVCLIIVITCMVKRVKLIIQLFKEASKAIFDIPALILMPVWTSMLVTITFLIFMTIFVSLLFAGTLTELAPNFLEYVQNGVMSFTLLYNVVVYIWVTEFIIGGQYMIIAGAVSAWFFTRNKHYLDSPLKTSFTNLTRFHLGTVAIGSLIITLMTIVRALIKSLAQNQKTKWIIDCCLANVEEFLRFLSKNAYIQTAMHGQPFFKSGKRAAKLLVSNAANVIAVNSIGDFVLMIAQLLVIIVCSVIGVFIAKATGTEHYWAISVICVFIAVCMAATFFGIMEATIDCIFICFCEDTTLNDGMARPYFMSKGLMQFIEDSKAVYPVKA